MSLRRSLLAATTSLAALVVVGASTPVTAVAAEVSAPVRSVVVSGAGVVTYPAFDPSVRRYGVTTTTATAGTLTVSATTSDPAGVVLVDGRPVEGATTLVGLSAGDEISVRIDDAAGTERHDWIYLPAGFPVLERTTPTPGPGQLSPGLTLLTLGLNETFGNPAAPRWETAVDVNGVPAVVSDHPGALDLKRAADGGWTVSRPTTTPGRTGQALVELDDQMREVARHETVGLVDTDGHDSILQPDGTAWLLAYEPDPVTHRTDAVVQRVDPDGRVGFTWTSAPYAAETVAPGVDPADYAHVNSLELMSGGDLLVSFRHLSSVYRIATTSHDGFGVGDVVWKLGGRDSDFAITGLDGSPDGGPCAQHSAHELPDGHVLLFDNGSTTFFGGPLCLGPDGRAVERGSTRVVELALDPASGTARVVRSYAPPGVHSIFAGSVQPMPDGHRIIGWAATPHAVASEITADGTLLWEVRSPATTALTYRAHRAPVADATPPVARVDPGLDGTALAQGQDVRAGFSCTDRGGSGLATCTGSTAAGASLDTSTTGRHRVVVTATDGAGNRSTATVTYTVEAAATTAAPTVVRAVGVTAARPDLVLRGPRGSRRTVVTIRNTGTAPDSFVVAGTRGGRSLQVTYRVGRTRVPRSGLLTSVLAPGASVRVTVRVARRAGGGAAEPHRLTVSATSAASPGVRASTALRVRVR